MRREVIGDAVLYLGDCMDVAAELQADSIDAIVSDPPYGLTFMDRDWDRGVPGVHFWQAFYRAVKPGAHVVAFGGTRTFHRQVVAIEDAGFEIRDQLGWLYGGGFPKSLDVAKAIDASDRIGTSRERALRFTEFMRSTGLTANDINAATDSNMASHYLTDKQQPAVATEDMFARLRPLIAARGVEIPADIEQLVEWRTVESENMKRRQVVGERVMNDTKHARPVTISAQGLEKTQRRAVQITAAHTEAAKKWEGWGTALKPAWEPICLARKPLVGTVAGNVMRYSVGAINIGGCRVEVYDDDEQGDRWPANIMHDGSDEVVALFPVDGDASAARFFYQGKAVASDREAGNVHPTVKPTDLMRWCVRLVAPVGAVVFDPFMGSGSTGKAAMLEGRRFVGAELDPEYFDIACRRIEAAYKAARAQPVLFDDLRATRPAVSALQNSLF
jgi:DNA modification methylase